MVDGFATKLEMDAGGMVVPEPELDALHPLKYAMPRLHAVAQIAKTESCLIRFPCRKNRGFFAIICLFQISLLAGSGKIPLWVRLNGTYGSDWTVRFQFSARPHHYQPHGLLVFDPGLRQGTRRAPNGRWPVTDPATRLRFANMGVCARFIAAFFETALSGAQFRIL
jgi:hypothetical protein